MTNETKSKRAVQRFFSKIKVEKGCWNWQGALDTYGYAQFHGIGSRYAYILFKGAIPTGLQLDHLCRNRKCVNPSHLEAVSAKENTLRGEGITAKNARKTWCPKNHPYDKENTVIYNNKRHCRECIAEQHRIRAANRLEMEV